MQHSSNNFSIKLAGVVTLLVGSSALAHAQSVTYDLNFLAGGENVSGTMTLSGAVNGPVSADDIVSFDIVSAPGGSSALNAVGNNASCMGGVGCGLTVSGDQLLWSPAFTPSGTLNLAGISELTLTGAGSTGQSQTVVFQGPGGGPSGCFSCGGLLQANGDIQLAAQSAGSGFSFTSLALSLNELLGTAADPVTAPEIDPAQGTAALTLMLGTLAILRKRRSS